MELIREYNDNNSRLRRVVVVMDDDPLVQHRSPTAMVGA